MRPDWSPLPLHGSRAHRLDARISGVMTVVGSLTAVPFAPQTPAPALALAFAGACLLGGVVMAAAADRVRGWTLSVASVVGAVGITTVAVHAPDGLTYANGPILYVVPVLQVGLLRGRREAWLQLVWAMVVYAAGLLVVDLGLHTTLLTTLPVLVTLTVLTVAVTWLRSRVQVLVGEVDRLISELRWQADHDPLTGLLNRQGLVRQVAHTEVLTQGTVLLLDIDHFKTINDTAGHLTGDRLLARLGELLVVIPRAPEMAVRVGGEEFLLILRGTDPDVARERAEALRREVGTTLTAAGSTPITVSIGVACGPFGDAFTGLYRQADDALYRAKDRGRDRVEVAGTDGTPAPHAAVVRRAATGRARDVPAPQPAPESAREPAAGPAARTAHEPLTSASADA